MIRGAMGTSSGLYIEVNNVNKVIKKINVA